MSSPPKSPFKMHRVPGKPSISATLKRDKYIINDTHKAYHIEGHGLESCSSVDLVSRLGQLEQSEPILALSWATANLISDTPFQGVDILINEKATTFPNSCYSSHCYFYCAKFPYLLVDFLKKKDPSLPVTPILCYSGSLIIGPTVDGSEFVCSNCWVSRLLINSPVLRERVAAHHEINLFEDLDHSKFFSLAKALWETPTLTRRYDTGVLININTCSIRHERLINFTNCSCKSPAQPIDVEDLVGSTWGVIKKCDELTGPQKFFTLNAAASRLADVTIYGAGCSEDPTMSRRKAIYEALERLACAGIQSPPTKVCEQDLALLSSRSLSCFHRYSDRQYKQEGFPYHKVKKYSDLEWVAGKRWLDDCPRILPACLASVANKKLFPTSSTGTSVGSSLGEAKISSILEIIERDVVMRTWFRRAIQRIQADDFVSATVDKLKLEGLNLELYACENLWGLPVLICWMFNALGHGALGTACDLRFSGACTHAIEEAYQAYFRFSNVKQLQPRPNDLNNLKKATAWCSGNIRLGQAIKHFDPVTIDLTTPALAQLGIYVVKAWSPYAVDFYDSNHIPQKIWSPSLIEKKRIQEEASLFV